MTNVFSICLILFFFYFFFFFISACVISSYVNATSNNTCIDLADLTMVCIIWKVYSVISGGQFTGHSNFLLSKFRVFLHVFVAHWPLPQRGGDPTIVLLWNDSISHSKVDMPIVTFIFFTFNLLTLTSEMHFFEVSPWGSFLFTLQRQNKVCTPGDEAIMKIHTLFTLFCYISKTTRNLKLKVWICNQKKNGLSFDIKKYTTYGWTGGMRIWSA